MAGKQSLNQARFLNAVASALPAVVAFFTVLFLPFGHVRAQSIRFSFPDGEPMWTSDGIVRTPNSFALKIGLVQDKVIQKEIEVVESQSRELQKIIEDHTHSPEPDLLAVLLTSKKKPEPWRLRPCCRAWLTGRTTSASDRCGGSHNDRGSRGDGCRGGQPSDRDSRSGWCHARPGRHCKRADRCGNCSTANCRNCHS
jgi:hypothetical protein